MVIWLNPPPPQLSTWFNQILEYLLFQSEFTVWEEGSWDTWANTYCSKDGGSIPFYEDWDGDRNGFGISQSECQSYCHKNSDCHYFSYGIWTKGVHGIWNTMGIGLEMSQTLIFFGEKSLTTATF